MVKADLTVLQNIIFPCSEICPENKLYFRAKSSADCYNEKEHILYIKNGVSFDTYFNTLAVGKYKEYCRPFTLYFRVRVSGIFVLHVYGVNKENGKFTEKCIIKRNIVSDRAEDFLISLGVVPVSSFSHIYAVIEGSGRMYKGSFECEDKESDNRIDIAVVICTFKREKFLLSNHRKICEYLKESSIFDTDNIHFYIVDNGRTLSREIIENDYITLIPNANTGGSGGFSRGYYEAVNSGSYTHILFMDDDIVLDCEMFLRVYSLLQKLKREYGGLAVGGTMLKLSDYVTQHEAGAYWNGKRLCSIGNGADMTLRENVFNVLYYPYGNYNAWWFCCFPSYWQEKYGYPLNFFVKEDDIEYSLRCADEIAVISGIAVWHDDFEGKYDGFQEYYIKRNELILTSVNDQKPYALFQLRKLVLSVMKQTVLQRYFLADIIFRAYDDYLLGWEHFKNTDAEKLNTELLNSCEKLLDDNELYKKYGVYFDEEKYRLSLTEKDNNTALVLTLNGYIIPSCFYKKDKDGFFVTSLAKCRYVNFYRHKRVLHYDTVRKKGFVTEQKRGKIFKYFFMLIWKSIKFLIKYPSVRRGYKQHLKELADYKPQQ